jgi:glycosyltransferase involved in cell wall biosynthesis
VAGGLGLGQLARARRAALIHSNTSVVLSGALAARVARVPHVWHVREIYTGFERAWPVYRRLLLGAAALPCVSAATRAQFGDAPRARVVHDGLAIEADAVAPAALELPSGALICATLGRVSSWKGQDVLLRAIAAAEGTAAVIAGDAWPGQEQRERDLRALAERLGIAARVRFVPFLDDPRPLYAAADVVVVPSTNPDPLPNAALEGAACGRCVVASAHGGLLEIVRDGETGLLVAPADHEALAAALRRLAGDRDLVRRLGEAARSDVRARFAPAALLERLQALYDELVPPAADAMA